MLPTMYGMQSNSGYGSSMASGKGSGTLLKRGGFANQNLFGGRIGTDSLVAENKESYSQERFGDYGDYGSYDYGGYGGYGTSKSGYGAQSHGSFAGYGKQCPGVSIALLLITLLGVALMGYILWSKIVAAGRRKRDVAEMSDFWWILDNSLPLLINGIDNFDEKLDNFIDENNDNDWIAQSQTKWLPNSEVKEFEEEKSFLMKNLWDVENQYTLTNLTAGDLIPGEDDEDVVEGGGGCLQAAWPCVSHGIAESLHYLDKPEDLVRSVKRVLYSLALSTGTVRSSISRVAEVEHMAQCLAAYQECIAEEGIRQDNPEDEDITNINNIK